MPETAMKAYTTPRVRKGPCPTTRSRFTVKRTTAAPMINPMATDEAMGPFYTCGPSRPQPSNASTATIGCVPDGCGSLASVIVMMAGRPRASPTELIVLGVVALLLSGAWRVGLGRGGPIDDEHRGSRRVITLLGIITGLVLVIVGVVRGLG